MSPLAQLLRGVRAVVVAAGLAVGTLACGQGRPSSVGAVDQGLLAAFDSGVWCIQETRDGALWFGTNGGGVVRYDGERLTRFTDEDGLAGDSLRGLVEDAQGRLLLSTTSGVSLFAEGSFRTLEIHDLAAGEGWTLRDDDLWFAFAPGTGGPCRWDGETLTRLVLPESPAEADWKARYPGSSFPGSGVYTVTRDRSGHVWIGTASVGLGRFDGRAFAWLAREDLTTTPSGGAFGIRSIHEDRRGSFWINNTRQRFEVAPTTRTEDGFVLLDVRESAGLPEASAPEDRNFSFYSSMAEDERGALWFACGADGVWRHDGDSVTRFPVGEDAYVLVVFLDREGRLWAGTLEDGVHVLEGGSFRPLRTTGLAK